MGRHFLLIQSELVFSTNVSPPTAAFVPAPVNTVVGPDGILGVELPNPLDVDELPKLLPPKPLVVDVVVVEPKPVLDPNPVDGVEPNAEDPDDDPVVVVDVAFVVPPNPDDEDVVVEARLAPNVLSAGNALTVGSADNASW
jgi:hypothetical protein